MPAPIVNFICALVAAVSTSSKGSIALKAPTTVPETKRSKDRRDSTKGAGGCRVRFFEPMRKVSKTPAKIRTESGTAKKAVTTYKASSRTGVPGVSKNGCAYAPKPIIPKRLDKINTKS